MPKLKQPAYLEKMASDGLLQSLVRCCDRLSTGPENSMDKFRHGISVIKEYVCKHIPSALLADFFCMFLDEFSSDFRSACLKKAALEIIMDVEIIGLKCKGPIVAFLDPEDGHRFQKLMELDLDCFSDTVPISLENFHLNDLTTFIFPKDCTDLDLTIIGQNCSRLEIVKVRDSKNVTDEGLRALSPCSELRVIDIVGCFEVSHIGINHLLSVHEKLNDFAYGAGKKQCILASSHLDLSAQCPAMNRFYIESGVTSDADLRYIVSKFPNLTYLGIKEFRMDSLSVLKSLNKLTKLEFSSLGMDTSRCENQDFKQMWESLEEILPCIGVNMTSLNISSCHDFFLREESLNSIYNSCPNIEHFKFDIEDGLMVIPPFQKLIELTVCCPSESFGWWYDAPKPVVKFVKMVKLETLRFFELKVSAEGIESIIFDDIKFPNLSLIETYGLKDHELLQFERNVRIKNLNLQIKNHSKLSLCSSSEICWQGRIVEPYTTISFSCPNLLEILY